MSSDADTAGEMSPDLVFEILSNTRRRMVLYHLRQYGGSATVQELANQTAALENDVPVSELTRQQRKRVYVSLYQTHLPKLEQIGIIEYDDEREEVFLTDRVGEIDSYLTPSMKSEYSWQLHYLGLSVVGGLLFVLSFVGIPVIESIPSLVLGLALMIAFGLSAVVQYRQRKRRQQELPSRLLKNEE